MRRRGTEPVGDLPPWSKTVHRSGADPVGLPLYTVPTGRTLYITSAYLNVTPDGAAARVVISTFEEQSAAVVDVLRLQIAAGNTTPVSERVSGLARRVPAGNTVDLSTGSGTVSKASGGFTGFLE